MLNSIPVAQLMVKTHVPLEGMMQERGKKKIIIIIIIYIIPLVKTVLIMITVHKVLVSYLLRCFTNFRWLRTGTC